MPIQSLQSITAVRRIMGADSDKVVAKTTCSPTLGGAMRRAYSSSTRSCNLKYRTICCRGVSLPRQARQPREHPLGQSPGSALAWSGVAS